MMKATEQTILQVERVINKIAQKYPKGDEVSVLTDIHIRVSQDTGEMLAFDDDEQSHAVWWNNGLTVKMKTSIQA